MPWRENTLAAPWPHGVAAVLVGAVLGVLLTVGPSLNFETLGSSLSHLSVCSFAWGECLLWSHLSPHFFAWGGGECFDLWNGLLELVESGTLGKDVPKVLLLDVLGSSSLQEDFWELSLAWGDLCVFMLVGASEASRVGRDVVPSPCEVSEITVTG